MGMWCDIPSHPTRPCQLPHPRPHPQNFTGRVADLQGQLFSLFFLEGGGAICEMKIPV